MNKQLQTIIWVIAAILIIWGLYSLFQSQAPGEEGPVLTGPVKIGVTGPFSGEAASFGDGLLGGIELAVKEINAAGGINGNDVEIIYEDDKCNAKDGSSAMNKLINVDKVDAVVGPVCSAAGGAGLPIAQNAGVPTIEFGSAPHLPKIGDYIFRTYPSDAFQGKFAAEYAFNNLEKTKAAVLYVKNDWGQGIRDVFIENFERLGGEIVYDEGVSQETKDLRSSIAKMKLANPDIIYLPAYPAMGVIALRQIKDMGLDLPILGGDAFDTDEVIKSGTAEDVMYTVAIIKNPDEFKQRVKEASGKDSNLASPLGYDAIYILTNIFTKVGTDKQTVRDELAKLSYKQATSLPLIEFDENGDLKSAEFEVKVVRNGESVLYTQ